MAATLADFHFHSETILAGLVRVEGEERIDSCFRTKKRVPQLKEIREGSPQAEFTFTVGPSGLDCWRLKG